MVPIIKLLSGALSSINDADIISIQIIKYCHNLTELFQKNHHRFVSDINCLDGVWVGFVFGFCF